MEMTIVNFGWFFDIYFKSPGLLVIWSLGISMIVLSLLVHLSPKAILIFSLVLIMGHNLFDGIHFNGNIPWSILHEFGIFHLTDQIELTVNYPIIPWMAVMSLGYYFGTFYSTSYEPKKRKKLLNTLGMISLLAFMVLRFLGIYGDPTPFNNYGNLSQNLISFLNPNKYPPSLEYVLMTLGVAFIFLANTEDLKGKLVNFFSTFGRVPFFYYILHLYLIHLIALIMAELSGFGWQKMILEDWVTEMPSLKGFGFPLWVVYVVWVFVILALYPLCKKFDQYKQANKGIWWLSYL